VTNASSPLQPALPIRQFVVEPSQGVHGELVVPGDKSISHRAAILAALAEGESLIKGFLRGSDCEATLRALEVMGAQARRESDELHVTGVGHRGLQPPQDPLDLGNSGTGLRLLAGLAAGTPGITVLTGDASLRRRPMGRIAEPLRQMGAEVTLQEGNVAPVTIQGKKPLSRIRYTMPVASAQVKSCVLLAALAAEGQTWVGEPSPTRDHTERLLPRFGVQVHRQGGSWVGVCGPAIPKATTLVVPGDLSTAAFFLAAALLSPGGSLLLRSVGINPTRVGVLHIMQAMGGRIEIRNIRDRAGEPFADLLVQHSALRGIQVPVGWVPMAIDELPIIAILAAFAQGTTTIRGAEELRHKESDRIESLAEGLRALQVPVEVFPDGLSIQGGSVGMGTVNSHGDHRIAMAFAMAGVASQGPITINDCALVDTSCPGFAELACQIGIRLVTQEQPA